ncbi:MAG: DUF1592 domain-containing protein [Acidobacteria bacterium]|nr:DUF1592 domain-containing protein [Acidobacteriota bacterium]
MKKKSIALLIAVVCLVAASDQFAQQAQPQQAMASEMMPLEAQTALLRQYCQGCHNDTARRGNMTLTGLDLTRVDQNAELAEKIIKKLKTGLMPPASSRRPERAALDSFVHTFETQLDKAAASKPNPGTRPFQRLTRHEYANSIRDLLGIEVDVAKYLAADTISEGFDNIADTQTFSASVLQGYIRAAVEITREAMGDPNAEPNSAVFQVNRLGSQLRHVPGTPFGTRGGTSVVFNFPADGEYSFRMLLFPSGNGALYGSMSPDEQIDVSIDGERVALINVPRNLSESTPGTGLNLSTGKIFVKTGPRRVAAAFIQKRSEIFEDNVAAIENTLVDTDLGRDGELTALPHLRELEISGPFVNAGVSDSIPRRRVFKCRPLSPSEEEGCARQIVEDLARKAFRRPLNEGDTRGLMEFFKTGRTEGGNFEAGIRRAMEAILASPQFIFKFEPAPATIAAGENYPISDLALASRLSYFLWGTFPDDELISVASQGKLKDLAELEKQTKRMLANPRSIWLSEKFAHQWLHLPDLFTIQPDPFYYPQYDYTLALSMLKEVHLFFNSIVREDRNVLDLLTADHTFADERLALHYKLPNIRGSQFRRVKVTEDYRRGLLGKGAILTLTSVADRTSPVLRGKWVMSVLLGTPPPPPPPVVPTLDETPAVVDKVLTVRERLEMHRSNPACMSCHQMIDPIGLALENFDVTGEWRMWDKTYAISNAGVRIHTGGIPIDSTTKLYDGTPLDGPKSLREAILKYSDPFIETLTENLMAFALGRRVEYYDMPAVRQITREAAGNNNRFSSLVIGIVKSPAFQMSRALPNTSVNAH